MSALIPTLPAPVREDIVAKTKDWLGTPYVHQASAKGAGADCLGLVRGLYRELYGYEPEAPPAYTPNWNERAFARRQARGGNGQEAEPLLAAAARNLVLVTSAKPGLGDVLVFRVVLSGPAKHCGIVSAPGRFIHAYAGRSVVESSLNRWWRARIAGVFSFPKICPKICSLKEDS